jgi:DNA-binding MarR family transcriptional regulator
MSPPLSTPGLGTLMRHLLELLDGDVEKVYRAAALDYRPRFTPVMRALRDLGPVSIKEIAAYAGVTHSAASQTVAAMRRKRLVMVSAAADGRARTVAMTGEAERLLPRLEEIWARTTAAAAALNAELPMPLDEVLASAIAALERRPFAQRIREQRPASATIRRKPGGER